LLPLLQSTSQKKNKTSWVLLCLLTDERAWVNCASADCKSYLSNSLFVFGEFGGNDYNAMLFGNYNTDQARSYTPQIVSTIADGVEV
jgi:hypothetical protein